MNNPFLFTDPWQEACIYAWSIGERYEHLPTLFNQLNVPIEDINLVIAYLELCDQHLTDYMLTETRRSIAAKEAHVIEYQKDSMSYFFPNF